MSEPENKGPADEEFVRRVAGEFVNELKTICSPQTRFVGKLCLHSVGVVLVSIACSALVALSWMVAVTIEKWQTVLQ